MKERLKKWEKKNREELSKKNKKNICPITIKMLTRKQDGKKDWKKERKKERKKESKKERNVSRGIIKDFVTLFGQKKYRAM